MLYLASTSPRRRQLLLVANIPHQLMVPGPEPRGVGSPKQLAVLRARAKAMESVAPQDAGPVGILGVDTVVDLAGQELGKPENQQQAAAMLQSLAGHEHWVHTAHCLRQHPLGALHEMLCSARVVCRDLDPVELAAYLEEGDWQGKAGGYGIQGAAGAFMTLLEGELDTVIGLHVAAVRQLMAQGGLAPC